MLTICSKLTDITGKISRCKLWKYKETRNTNETIGFDDADEYLAVEKRHSVSPEFRCNELIICVSH